MKTKFQILPIKFFLIAQVGLQPRPCPVDCVRAWTWSIVEPWPWQEDCCNTEPLKPHFSLGFLKNYPVLAREVQCFKSCRNSYSTGWTASMASMLALTDFRGVMSVEIFVTQPGVSEKWWKVQCAVDQKTWNDHAATHCNMRNGFLGFSTAIEFSCSLQGGSFRSRPCDR